MSKPIYKNVHEALVTAQSLMGPVVKGHTNPHFKSRYSDLSDTHAVALPALNECGLCLTYEMEYVEKEMFMTAVVSHGSSDTQVRCRVPLIIDKNNMQGMKSATTFAKRIGVESLCAIAPEDDDGNASSPQPSKPQVTQTAYPKPAAQPGFDPKNSVHLKAITDKLESLGVKGMWRANVINAMTGKSMTELSNTIELCNPEKADAPAYDPKGTY